MTFEGDVKTAVKELHEKFDRMTLAILTGSISLTVALIVVALTIIAQG